MCYGIYGINFVQTGLVNESTSHVKAYVCTILMYLMLICSVCMLCFQFWCFLSVSKDATKLLKAVNTYMAITLLATKMLVSDLLSLAGCWSGC